MFKKFKKDIGQSTFEAGDVVYLKSDLKSAEIASSLTPMLPNAMTISRVFYCYDREGWFAVTVWFDSKEHLWCEEFRQVTLTKN